MHLDISRCLALRLLACRIKGCLGPKGPEPHDCNWFMERVKDPLKLHLCQTVWFISQLYVKLRFRLDGASSVGCHS